MKFAVCNEIFEIVDCKAMSNDIRPIEKIIRLFAPYIRHVHANDANAQAPGFGRVDYKAILTTLADAGYDGYVSMEAFRCVPSAEAVVPTALKYLKSCLPG